MTKTDPGRFFEDYAPGQVIRHIGAKTLTPGERAVYQSLYPTRLALTFADPAARVHGLPAAPLDDLIVFHTVFGLTVPDISLNAVANLGYAEGRWLSRVWPGDTLTAASEVIGVKETSSGKTGIVWVRTTGTDQDGRDVLSYVRWVMVRKRDAASPAPDPVVPALAAAVAPGDLVVPEGLDLSRWGSGPADPPHRWGDYALGEVIDHVDGVTVEEAEHMMATRLWQNTAKVHFDGTQRPDGKRLVYGGHVISTARALSFNGLGSAQFVVGLNAGSHVAPCFAGDTLRAWSEVLETAETPVPSVGALRLRLVATTGEAGRLRADDGTYAPGVLLDLDYWALVPR